MAHKALSLASLTFLVATGGLALAQSSAPTTDPSSVRQPNVAATGKHMPAVGLSKSAGITPLDKKEEDRMRHETTICKGC